MPIAFVSVSDLSHERRKGGAVAGSVSMLVQARKRASLRFPGLRPLSCLLAMIGGLSLHSLALAGALTEGERAYARHDYVRAAPLLRAEAARGSPAAQTYIGFMYQNGLGVPRNYHAAAAWLNEAAQQGEPTAQFLLGLLFDKGFGVPMDWVQAEVWLNLAASQASRSAARLLELACATPSRKS